jgi:hypothetical protein
VLQGALAKVLAGLDWANAQAYARTIESDHPLCAIVNLTLRDLLRPAHALRRRPSARAFLAALIALEQSV